MVSLAGNVAISARLFHVLTGRKTADRGQHLCVQSLNLSSCPVSNGVVHMCTTCFSVDLTISTHANAVGIVYECVNITVMNGKFFELFVRLTEEM